MWARSLRRLCLHCTYGSGSAECLLGLVFQLLVDIVAEHFAVPTNENAVSVTNSSDEKILVENRLFLTKIVSIRTMREYKAYQKTNKKDEQDWSTRHRRSSTVRFIRPPAAMRCWDLNRGNVFPSHSFPPVVAHMSLNSAETRCEAKIRNPRRAHAASTAALRIASKAYLARTERK